MVNSAVRLLDRAAELFADREAIEDVNSCLTYKEYREASRRIGTGLLQADCRRRPILVMLPKCTAALTCFMGAMYAGCPYVPMNYGTPLPRLDKMVDNLNPGAIITDSGLLEDLTKQYPDIKVFDVAALSQCETDEEGLEAMTSTVIDTDPVYIIYTSGSTGMPKGVTMSHRGVIDYAQWVKECFDYDTTTVMASQAPFYFDNSVFDIYGCMYSGGKMVMIPDVLYMFPAKLPQFLADHEITSIFWVPTLMIFIANSGALDKVDLPKLKTVAFAGEVMPNTQLNIWRRALPGRVFANLYGPTEICDVSCYYIVDREFADSDPLPIGVACENMRMLILTEDGREAEVNEQGEICILGSGVALGYWNAPEQTAKVFVNNPLRPEVPQRMYRSGDLGYKTEEGLIMYQGRMDNQIKVRGNRIELGEIESAAMCVEGVENVCAVFEPVKQEIVLFLETQQNYTLRKFNMEMKKFVPKYMLPAKVICMPNLPHTPNDKIDRVLLKKKLEEEA